MTTIEPGGTRKPTQPIPAISAKPQPAVERPEVAAKTAPGPADRMAVGAEAVEVVVPARRTLAAAPVEAPRGFTSHGAVAPATPGPIIAMRSATGDFEVQAYETGGAASACLRVAVRLGEAGPVVRFDAEEAGATLNGAPLPPSDRGEPVALPGGGELADWGHGFQQLTTAVGDTVCIYDLGGRLAYSGELSPARGPGECQGAGGWPGIEPKGPGLRFKADGAETDDPIAFLDSWRPTAGKALV